MAALLLSLIGIASLTWAGVAIVKLFDQAARDRQRKTYRLGMPADLTEERVTAWNRSFSGTFRVDKIAQMFQGLPTIVIETWGTPEGISWLLKVPYGYETAVRRRLESLVPGIQLVEEKESPVRVWVHAVELKLRAGHRPLHIPVASDVSTAILANFGQVADSEALVMQWVISPIIPEHKPIIGTASSKEQSLWSLLTGSVATKDEINDRRDKLEEPNFQTTVRVAAVADTEARAKHMVRDVTSCFDAIRGAANYFIPKLLSADELQRRVTSASTPMNLAVQVSAPELTALMGFPLGNPTVAGMPSPVSRRLPTPLSVPSEGIVLGASNYAGRERAVALGFKEALVHQHVLGPPGCLHPDTPVYDPVDGSTQSVEQRYRDAKPFHVFAMDGNRLVVTEAEAPVKYYKTEMVELYNDEQTITVTPKHRVWDGSRFVAVSELQSRPVSGHVQLPSILEHDLSRLREDAQRLIETHGDSLDGCPTYFRSCDPQPLGAEDTDLVSAPSRADAHAPCCLSYGMDDQAHTRGRSPACQPFDHQPRSSSPGLDEPRCEAGCRQVGGISQMSYGISLDAAAPRDHSSRPRTAGCTLQSGQLSTGDTLACAPVQPGWTYMRGGLLGSSHESSPLCRSRCSRRELDQESLEPVQTSKPQIELLFNSYFQNNTYRIRQATDETYYDFHVPGLENYLACGLIHHNTGKTALLANEAKQIIDAGFGLIMIEQKGDFFNEVLNYIPDSRVNDVIILDVNDQNYPVAFNVLRQGDPKLAVDGISAIIRDMYPDHPSIYAEQALYNGLKTLADDPNSTVIDLLALVSPTEDEVDWANALRGKAKDPQIRRYWQTLENEGKYKAEQRMAPINNRFWPMERSNLVNIIGQSKSTFTMEEVVRENKILLVNLSGIDTGAASVMGAIIVNALWQTVKRYPMPTSPNYLMMDEAHHFMNLPVDLGLMLVEARKFGLGMVFAHQGLYQLPTAMKAAIQQNTQTKLVFQMMGDDVREMTRTIGSPITDHDLASLAKYETIGRVATPVGTSAPLTMSTLAPAKGYGNAQKVIYASRGRYGRPVREVQDEILARRIAPEKPRRYSKPDDSAEAWGI